MARSLLIRVLFFQDPDLPDTWIAQALEHDIAAFGPDVEHAKLAFERTINGYIQLARQHDMKPLASLNQAPDMFWELWDRAADSRTVQAEPFPSIPGHMLPVVTHDRVSTTH